MALVHYPSASLKPHRAESLQGGHLWIFSGALQQPPHWVESGGLLDVKSDTGKFIARGYYNANTDIAIRILTHNEDEDIDADFIRRRVHHACTLREVFPPEQTNAYRLINSEGDNLPGLVVDRYGDFLVVQIHTAGMEQLRPLVIAALEAETDAKGILLRNDGTARRREGLATEEPVVVSGDVPRRTIVRENGIQFEVDLWEGQKTGFFLDQRDKRAALQKYVPGKHVLNCFSYTGGFSVYAALTGPETRVTSVDISAPAMKEARKVFSLNGLDPLSSAYTFEVADVFEYLEQCCQDEVLFDVVVLDPPAFAKTLGVRTHALKAYRRLNTLGMQVLRPGGILVTCSCSGVVGMDDLSGAISVSAQRLHRSVQLLESYTHGVDHPINLAMPETAYLKAVFTRIS